MTSLSAPPRLIEHELYVENAVWILHTFSTRKCSSNECLRAGVGGGGGGGTLIFSYIRRLVPFFWVQRFEFQYFWGFRKMNVFEGMKILWIFLWGHHKIGLYRI